MKVLGCAILFVAVAFPSRCFVRARPQTPDEPSSAKDCQCARYYSCLARTFDEETVNEDGRGILIARRLGSECQTPADTCCSRLLNGDIAIGERNWPGNQEEIEEDGRFERLEDCTCVPSHVCQNGRIVDDGAGVLIPRQGTGLCKDRYYVCCPNTVVKRKRSAALGCGVRNPNGINETVSYVGSESRAQYGEFPWMVQIIGVNDKHVEFLGGGSLIHPRIVLTAAHIVKKDQRIIVRVGSWSLADQLGPPATNIRVRTILIHPDYNSMNFRFDVALLFLKTEAPLSDRVNTICLAPLGCPYNIGDECFVTGWGFMDSRSTKDEDLMKKLKIKTVPRDECQSMLRKTALGPSFKVHDVFLCAGGVGGPDACIHDAGGPLVCPISGTDNQYVQIGIVAAGLDCGEAGVPGLYTNVETIRNWIDSETEKGA